MTHPNTVAYSAGAVCCPDEVSARRHIDACIWFVDGVEHYMTPLVDPDGVWLTYDWPERRWTR